MSGKAIDLGGTGVQAATQAKVVNSSDQKANTDNTYGGRLVYMAINTKLAPFDKVECRKAVEFAVNKVSVQTALVHLCGAVGARVLVMVPYAPEWRYAVGTSTMPWYGSAHLFRQADDRDWAPVIRAVGEALDI